MRVMWFDRKLTHVRKLMGKMPPQVSNAVAPAAKNVPFFKALFEIETPANPSVRFTYFTVTVEEAVVSSVSQTSKLILLKIRLCHRLF